MTNADVIRKMTDEQLDEFLAEWEYGDIDYAITFCDLCKKDGNTLNLDCDGCRKYWLKRDAVEYGGLLYWKRNTTIGIDGKEQTQDGDRAVSLNAVLDICRMAGGDGYGDVDANKWIAREVRKLTPITPHRPKGHWIMTSDYFTGAYESIDYVECSCCHEYSLEEGDYCPNCGADMRGDDT